MAMNTRRSSQTSLINKPAIERRRSPRLKKDAERPTSPESHCPICLGDVVNKSYTNSCLHEFCFRCLREWSKIKPECPLCKQQFSTIYHNIRAIDDYDEHKIQPPADIFLALRTPNLILRPPAELYATGNAFSMYFPMWRGGNQDLLGFHRRENRFIELRRQIYRENLWSRPNTLHRLRESHPEFYSENPALVNRLTPWLLRELSVLLDNASHVPTLVAQIEVLVSTHLILSDHFHHALSPYLGERTAHFIHEFYHFAISPYDMLLHDIRNSYYNPSEINQHSHTSRSILNLFSRSNFEGSFEDELTLRIFELPTSPAVSAPVRPRSPEIVINLLSDDEYDPPQVLLGEIDISDTDDEDDIEVVDEVIPKPEVIIISSASEGEQFCPCPSDNKCPYSTSLSMKKAKEKQRVNYISSDASKTVTCHSDSDCSMVVEKPKKRVKKLRKTRKRVRARSPQPTSSRAESSRKSRSDRPMPSTSRARSVSSSESENDNSYKSCWSKRQKRRMIDQEKYVKNVLVKHKKLKSVVLRPSKDSD